MYENIRVPPLGQVKVAANHINAKCFACELWVKRVGTFGVVLYRHQ